MATETRIRKSLVGKVKSSKMAKTIVVEVERRVAHARYGKVVRMKKSFKAHDERGEAKPGDTVQIEECRPLSADKRFRLRKILTRAVPGSVGPAAALPGDPPSA